MSQYLSFKTEYIPGRKTPICTVYSKSSHKVLGHIKWYASWRQFTFWPAPYTIWNSECLEDIRNSINDVAMEYAIKKYKRVSS